MRCRPVSWCNSLLVVVSVAPSPLSTVAAAPFAASTSPSLSAAAAFTLSTAAPLPLSTTATFPVTAMATAALLPVRHRPASYSTACCQQPPPNPAKLTMSADEELLLKGILTGRRPRVYSRQKTHWQRRRQSPSSGQDELNQMQNWDHKSACWWLLITIFTQIQEHTAGNEFQKSLVFE